MADEVRRGIYRHYKGGGYEVIGVGSHTESGERLVFYSALSDGAKCKAGELFARPVEMFNESVEHDGEMVPRFRFVSPSGL